MSSSPSIDNLIHSVLSGIAPQRAILEATLDKYKLEQLTTVGTFAVYKVNGDLIRAELDPDFTNFGHHLSHQYIPEKEFWVDKDDLQELPFYVTHLVAEHRAMENGMSYNDALDIADKAERKERAKSSLYKQHQGDPDKAQEVKKELLGRKGDVRIWLVDGELVRDFFLTSFIEGGHDLVYKWISKNEVWIDDEVSEEERDFVILHELIERREMARGTPYNKAHATALHIEVLARNGNNI